MHGSACENWKRRLQQHMWSVPAPVPSPLVLPFSSISTSSISLIQSSTDSFLKDGRKIRVGDCALFQAGNAPPFIGIIRWFTTSKEEDCLKLCVNWLYRPSDIKLAKGILLEAAPNELFYSFHKDVISAASLLHPCRVAFLRKGVELPSGISSFICRRVYDIANKCLWWLTDQDYINERQEEVDQLLDKTRLEMHASVQSGGRSPKSLNSPTLTQQQKSSTENAQKSKKRERGGNQGMEPIKRERPTKPEDGELTSSRLENMIKSKFSKITEKGVLMTIESVDKLVHLMQLDKNERKIDLDGRLLLADVISATERIECLSRFVQLRGVPVLDDWLQEAHNKGKNSDGSSPKENDKGAEELLLALLRALDKLPINLNALQTCNIGKSVNHLRSHKNPEIQKKARSLVDTWKKRVDAEMIMLNDGKSGFSEAPHAGGGHIKTSITHASSSACKTLLNKPSHADAIVKSTPVVAGSLKLPSSLPASVSIGSKDSPVKGTASSGNSELPLASAKEEKSTGSSQSMNNSQSSWKEDAKSSTAGSLNANKPSRHRRSSNGFSGNNSKDGNMGKTGKVSSHNVDTPGLDHGNSHRLIVRLANRGKSPARNSNGGPVEENLITEKHDTGDRKTKLKGDALQTNTITDVNVESCPSNGLAAVTDEESRSADLTCKTTNSSLGNGKGVSSTITKPKNSFSSMNALVESCAKYSETSTSPSAGDDIGINLLANVAAGEISTPSVSPKTSPKEESYAANSESKSKLSCDDGVALNCVHSDEIADHGSTKQETNDKPHDAKHASVDNTNSLKPAENHMKHEVKSEEKRVDGCLSVCTTNIKEKLEDDRGNQPAVDDKKPVEHKYENKTDASGKEVSAGAVPSDLDQSSSVDIKLKTLISEIAEAHRIKKSEELDVKILDSSVEANEKQTDPSPSNNELLEDVLIKKEGVDVRPVSDSDKPSSTAPIRETEDCAHTINSEKMKPDKGTKLDFDLNEGFSVDDCNQSEQIVTSVTPVCASLDPLPTISPFIASVSNGPHAHITVASPAKGPFMPPENLLKCKTEAGWKGSAATSAFRPAEPRKVVEMPLNTSTSDAEKQGRPPFEIDLNVADEMVLEEDMAPQSSTQTAGSESGLATKSAGVGLDLDLNKADESIDTGQFLASSSSRVEVPFMPVKSSSASRGFPVSESNMLRDFDLNNGPGADEVGTEMNVLKSQHAARNSSSSSHMGFTPYIENIPSWFPPGNTYPAVAIPSFLPTANRVVEQQQQQPFPIVAAPHGNQRILSSVTGHNNTFGGDIYRGGPVLSSSPAMPFSPSAAFPYPSFPFGSTFPLTSTSFSTVSTPPYVDSSCFQAIPSQLMGPTGTVPSHYARPPYMVSLPEGSMNSGSDRNRWVGGGQGLDLNAGPGSITADLDVKDDRRSRQQFPIGSSQTFVEEQARMYQMSGGGMKRKDREGSSWDDRYYKQPSWQ